MYIYTQIGIYVCLHGGCNPCARGNISPQPLTLLGNRHTHPSGGCTNTCLATRVEGSGGIGEWGVGVGGWGSRCSFRCSPLPTKSLRNRPADAASQVDEEYRTVLGVALGAAPTPLCRCSGAARPPQAPHRSDMRAPLVATAPQQTRGPTTHEGRARPVLLRGARAPRDGPLSLSRARAPSSGRCDPPHVDYRRAMGNGLRGCIFRLATRAVERIIEMAPPPTHGVMRGAAPWAARCAPQEFVGSAKAERRLAATYSVVLRSCFLRSPLGAALLSTLAP